VAGAVIDLTDPQRQSPLAIVLIGIGVVRSLGIVQLVVAVAVLLRWAADGRLLFAIVVVGALFLAVSVLSWWRYTFRVVDNELVVTRGVLRTDRLTVPVGRIQSVAIEQELLHRATGLVKVVIDTAGSSQAEFAIDAVARPVADELHRRVGAGADRGVAVAARVAEEVVAEGEASGSVERLVFQHDWRRLVLTALTMSPWAGLALLVPLLAFSQEAFDPLVDRVSDVAPEVTADSLGWWSVPAIVALALVIVAVLNLSRVLLADWGLALRSDTTRLRRTAGLLSRTSTTCTRNRVQVMTSRRNPLQRRVGLRDVHLSNAGAGDLRFGGCRADEVAAIAALVGLTPLDEHRPDRRVRPALVWLRVRNTTVAVVVVVVVALLVVGSWWAMVAAVVGVALVAVVWWATDRHVRTHRWSLGPELATSSHVIASSTEQVLLRKTNSVKVTQTMFERRRRLGRVHVATAAGTVTIGMIPIDEAHAVRDVMLYGVETDRCSWM
jgi:putative membrane protein